MTVQRKDRRFACSTSVMSAAPSNENGRTLRSGSEMRSRARSVSVLAPTRCAICSSVPSNRISAESSELLPRRTSVALSPQGMSVIARPLFVQGRYGTAGEPIKFQHANLCVTRGDMQKSAQRRARLWARAGGAYHLRARQPARSRPMSVSSVGPSNMARPSSRLGSATRRHWRCAIGIRPAFLATDCSVPLITIASPVALPPLGRRQSTAGSAQGISSIQHLSVFFEGTV